MSREVALGWPDGRATRTGLGDVRSQPVLPGRDLTLRRYCFPSFFSHVCSSTFLDTSCDRISYCHQNVPGPRAKPSEDSTRPRAAPRTGPEWEEKLPRRRKASFSLVSTAAHQPAVGNKRTSFSFSAIILFQRKKKEQNNLCIWGWRLFLQVWKRKKSDHTAK